MKAHIVPEGEQSRYTPSGIVLSGEFGRPVTVTCIRCSRQERLHLCADDLIDDGECDAVLTDHLKRDGWDCADGDLCPDCPQEKP